MKTRDLCSKTFAAIQQRPDGLTDWSEVGELELMQRVLGSVGDRWEEEGPLCEADALRWYAHRSGNGVVHSVMLSIEPSADSPPERLIWEVEMGEEPAGPPSKAHRGIVNVIFAILGLIALVVGILVWRWTGESSMALSADVADSAMRFFWALVATFAVLIPLVIMVPALVVPKLSPDIRKHRAPTEAFRTLVGRMETYLRSSESPFQEIEEK